MRFSQRPCVHVFTWVCMHSRGCQVSEGTWLGSSGTLRLERTAQYCGQLHRLEGQIARVQIPTPPQISCVILACRSATLASVSSSAITVIVVLGGGVRHWAGLGWPGPLREAHLPYAEGVILFLLFLQVPFFRKRQHHTCPCLPNLLCSRCPDGRYRCSTDLKNINF